MYLCREFSDLEEFSLERQVIVFLFSYMNTSLKILISDFAEFQSAKASISIYIDFLREREQRRNKTPGAGKNKMFDHVCPFVLNPMMFQAPSSPAWHSSDVPFTILTPHCYCCCSKYLTTVHFPLFFLKCQHNEE